jgi:excisionase family DNA binding protein
MSTVCLPAPPPDDGARFLTLERAAQRTGLSQTSIRRAIGAGKLEAFRPTGRRVLVEVVALDKFVRGAG